MSYKAPRIRGAFSMPENKGITPYLANDVNKVVRM